MTTRDGKTLKNRPKSVLEVTRCRVKIFEGSQAHLQVLERAGTSDFGRSVQFFFLASFGLCMNIAGYGDAEGCESFRQSP